MSSERIHADMRAAVRAALIAPGVLPDPGAVDWEGKEFMPTPGRPWARERMRPIRSEPRGLGRGGAISHRIAMIVTLFRPRRSTQGTLEVETDAGVLLGAFAPGTPLVRGDSAGTVIAAERAAIIIEPDWLSLPVTLSILAYTAG